MLINKVLFVGLGLIGGSLALTIKKTYPHIEIIGIDAHQESLDLAIKQGTINSSSIDFSQTMNEVDVIFLCTPVKATMSFLQLLSSQSNGKQLIVTDVGSTKHEITQYAEEVLPECVTFIGGHPMAGSHKSGYIAADNDLFENAYYIFTPVKKIFPNALLDLQTLLKGTRAKFVEMDAKKHDEITGMVSHLPHIISASLVHQNEKFSKMLPESNRFAAGGFRDMTRIAASDPTMWTDILLSNKEIILSLLDDWQNEMNLITHWLNKEQKAEIYDFFATGKKIRESLPAFKEGAIPAFHDIFVIVPDHPGVIADVTRILAQKELSLINLKIIENREGIMGTLQLTLKSEKDVFSAKNILETVGKYECHLM